MKKVEVKGPRLFKMNFGLIPLLIAYCSLLSLCEMISGCSLIV
jgi:hypothetical protein